MYSPVRAFAVALWLAVTLCNGQERREAGGNVSQAHTARTLGVKRRVEGVGNFGEVTPRLFRGAQPSPGGFDALAKMGIDIVVDASGAQSASEEKEVQRRGMRYVAIRWHCSSPHDEVFARFLRLVRENPSQKVFVHCHLGKDRTGMMVASYRMADEGWSADEAMLEMQGFGFSSAHHLLCPHLASYERSFPGRLQNNAAFAGLR